MNEHIDKIYRVVAAAALLALGSIMPTVAVARPIWNQGRVVHPRVAACATEKAADHGALLSWETCMDGQLSPPPEPAAAARYWLKRRKCRGRYDTMLKAHSRYQACERRLKASRKHRN